MLRFAIILFAALSSLNVQAAVISLNNGDRVSGEVSQACGDEVILETKLGQLTIPTTLIASVDGDKDLQSRAMAACIDHAAIAAVRLAQALEQEQKPRTILGGHTWASNVGLNSSISRGNTHSQTLNLKTDLKLEKNKYRYLFDISSLREEQNRGATKEQDRLALSYNYLFGEPWYFALNVTAERDPIALLDSRTSINPALGYDIWNETGKTLSVELGAGYANEKTAGIDESSSLIDWRLKFDYDIGDQMKLFHNHRIYKKQSGLKNTVFNSSTGIQYAVTESIFVNVQLDYDYDDSPPLGTEDDDLTFLIGAGVTL